MNGYNSEQPVSIGDWILTYLILCIPCIGLIMMFVWAFGGNVKPSKRAYCRAMLLISAISIVLAVTCFVMTGVASVSVNY